MKLEATGKSGIWQKFGPLLALVLLFIVITVLNPSFMEPNNILNLLRQTSINALIAFGMTFIILTGGIDLSVGSILALSSALMAGMMVSGLDPILAILVGILLGAIMGVINGILVSKGKMAPFIVTLATMTIFRGLTLVYTDGKPITGIGDSEMFQMLGRGYFLGLPVPAVVMVIAFLILWFLLHKTSFGRKTYAIGGNERASRISGIKVDRVKVAIYGLAGTMAAIAGAILTSRLNSAQPTAGQSYEMDAIKGGCSVRWWVS
jgi:ribose transport system permease protein